MVAMVELRRDFDAAGLRRLARKSKDSGQARWTLALEEIYDDNSRSEALGLKVCKEQRRESDCASPSLRTGQQMQLVDARPTFTHGARQVASSNVRQFIRDASVPPPIEETCIAMWDRQLGSERPRSLIVSAALLVA